MGIEQTVQQVPFLPNRSSGTFTSYEWNKVQAAIALKVPQSGIPELDAMIRESRRLDMATAAMQGIVVGRATYTNEWAEAAVAQADALLAASESVRHHSEPSNGKASSEESSDLGTTCPDAIDLAIRGEEGWIEWHGGECPVPAKTQVEVRLLGGRVLPPCNAGDLTWKHDGTHHQDYIHRVDPGCYIIAYRVVQSC